MKFRTRRTSKSSSVTDNKLLKNQCEAELTKEVGRPGPSPLAPDEETLFRAFQSNLLSLISHEVRTPLTSILNALEALDGEGDFNRLTQADFIQMARQNALKLNQVLLSLLDLAALEGGTFRARLREVELKGFIQGRLESHQSFFRENNLKIEWLENSLNQPLLADPQKLIRAIDLCIQIVTPRAQPGSTVKIRISSSLVIQFEFQIDKAKEKCWESVWSKSLNGFYSGVMSPYSAFAGILQSERGFLSRTQEGLGSELLLIHEIMRVHHGKFSSQSHAHQTLTLSLEFPVLTPAESLNIVLGSRTEQISLGLGSLALVLFKVPAELDLAAFLTEVKSHLFRTTDTAYALPDWHQVALVLDDCQQKDILPLIQRMQRALNRELPYGIAHCPIDGYDPVALYEYAQRRLKTL